MKDGDLDAYITRFKLLLGQAGYQETEQGALTMFKKGLPAGLNIRIISNVSPQPTTLAGWIEKAREQQLKWIQIQEFKTAKLLTPRQATIAKALALGKSNHSKRDPNAMDVDSGETENIRFTPLTEEEREELRKKGACYRCRKQGHIANKCPKKKAEYGRPAPTSVKAQGENTNGQKDTKKSLEELKEILKDEDLRQEFFNDMVESGFV